MWNPLRRGRRGDNCNLHFADFGTRAGEPYQVRVRGWNQLSGQERWDFISTVSDHSALYAEIT